MGSILILIGILLVSKASVQYSNKQTYTGTITDKYNKRSDETDLFYIVLDDERVIENRDALFVGKFDSADIQARMKVGTKVKVKTMGYRVHFLNMYPNLYEVEELK
ncbi:hypothetical protein [Staphylococcus simulans]|uniref:hypothetical protein n=1 Tax=Staphylococcus simulans TaxID=1286 RepID=UPI000E69046B|nr:hypothetical protein [Staphylococcus simulans]RIN77825.1 hypothetical protein BU015_04825 [Staphylococcus simulans]